MTEDKIRAQLWKLREFLVLLQARSIECIEYGWKTERNSDSFYSYLRIRYMKTAGGVQFGLKLIHNGIEGSGFYTPELEDIFEYARKQMEHFHRPMNFPPKFRERMEKIKMDYEWFACDGEQTKYHRDALDRLGSEVKVGKFLPGATAVDLEAP